MDSLEWKLIESEYIFRDDWLTARRDRCEMPDGRVVESYYVLEYPEWANVVALTEDNLVLLIRQYRHALGRVITELPCGVVEPGEAPMEAMRRELLEETGYEAAEMMEMAALSPNAATCTNLSHFFLARGARKIAGQRLDSNEQIEVLPTPWDEVIAMARRGEIMQATHVATLFMAEKTLIELGLIG